MRVIHWKGYGTAFLVCREYAFFAENQAEIIKNIYIIFAEELKDYILLSSLKKISEYRSRYSFFRYIAPARHS